MDLQFKVNRISNFTKCNFFKANLVANEAALVWLIYGRVEGEKGQNERE